MRVTAAVLLLAALAPNLALAQVTYVPPASPVPYRGYGSGFGYGNGAAIPYPPSLVPYSGSVAAGTYPPGARTCVAQDQICAASAPNTIGNPCTCTGRDGQPSPGMVR